MNRFGGIAEGYLQRMEDEGAAAAPVKKNRWLLIDLAGPELGARPIADITPPDATDRTQRASRDGAAAAELDRHRLPVRDLHAAGHGRSHPSARANAASQSLSPTSWRSLFGHEFGGAVQALFGLDPLGCGEAVLTTSVRSEFDQIGRPLHRAHGLVELLYPVAVPVREYRHVAPREGGLLVRDRVERDERIGGDARAIVAGDLAVHFGSFGASIPSPSIRCAGRRMPAFLGLREAINGAPQPKAELWLFEEEQ